MIEPYQWLIDNAERYGYNPDNCGPASVDLCLDQVRCPNGEYVYMNRGDYLFTPGGFFLCNTIEYIRIPLTHAATINMRSSLARRGLGHKMAGFIDPGFEGQITLELESALAMTIKPGERIVQLIFHRLTEPTHKPYTGRYQRQTGPTEAYKP